MECHPSDHLVCSISRVALDTLYPWKTKALFSQTIPNFHNSCFTFPTTFSSANLIFILPIVMSLALFSIFNLVAIYAGVVVTKDFLQHSIESNLYVLLYHSKWLNLSIR